MLPTVRVANPADRNQFMTINASDYREIVHGPLWPQQAPGFAGTPIATPDVTYTTAERDLAGALMLDVMVFDSERKGETPAFHTLSPGQRITYIRDQRIEFEKYRSDWQRSRQQSQRDLFSSEPQPQQQAPAAEDAPPYVAPTLEDAPPDPNAPGDVVEPDPNPGPTLDDLLGDQPVDPAQPPQSPAPSEPAPPAGPTPSWASRPAAPPADEAIVAKGPGSKFYVMRGGVAVSQGYKTKAEADAELPNHAAQ